MKHLLTLLLLACVLETMASSPSKKEILRDYNYIVGTQTVGAKYKFTRQTNLVETAIEIAKMGSNTLKISMSPRYWWENYDVPQDESITSLCMLAQEESFRRVLDMKFKYYQIWAYEFSQYTAEPAGQKMDQNQIKFIDGLSDEEAACVYREMYELSKYLLRNYSGTGKVFMLGNWEGDWHLRWDYNRHKDANPATIEGMIRWINMRQKAVDDAKRDVIHNDVELYHYLELNLSDLALAGKACLTNSILPHVNPDYVSFSSYTATNPPKTQDEMEETLVKHLDYIASKIQPKKGIDGKRLFIGEYGWNVTDYSLEEVDRRAKWVIKTALNWGCSFILFWEMYNNELTDKGANRGYWLIDENRNKTPLYHTHRNFYKEGRRFVKKFYKQHHRIPSQTEFSSAAVNFESLK